MSKKIVSLIIPCHNEEENVSFAYEEIQKTFEKLPEYEFEIVFVDDGSKDNTILEVEQVIKKDEKVKLIEFSRNFGKEIATTAGIQNCTGDCCIIFDADLQYPIEKLPDFLEKWKNGTEVVVGIRDSKKTNNPIDKIGSFLFYKIINLIGEIEVRSGALDFRLLDRKVIDIFKSFTERGRMTRALVDWLGFKRDYVHYIEKPRYKGTASYSFVKRIQLALFTFISHSLLPLKFAGYLGGAITFLSGTFGFFALLDNYILNHPSGLVFSGSFLLGILNLFLIGIVLICLGLIALYIATIHTEVTNRPLYVIRHSSGFDKDSLV